MLRIEKILLFLALVTVFGLAASQVHSFDIFWQLRSAEQMLETGSFIYTDTFSLAAEAERFEHCWLHDLIFYGAYRLAGYDGISVLKGLLVLGTGLAVVAAARVRGASVPAILLLALPALFMTRGGWLERPQLWTFLLFAVFLLLLERYRRQAGREIFLLAPLMMLWANLHAGAVLALPVLAAYLLGAGAARRWRRNALPGGSGFRLAGAVLLTAAAMLATPYSKRMLSTLLSQLLLVLPKLGGGASGQGNIVNLLNMEWQPTTFASQPFFFYALGLTGLLLLLGRRRLALTDLLLLGGSALMGWRLGRHTPIFFLAAGTLLPVYADAAVAPLVPRLKNRFLPLARALVLLTACLVLAYFAYPAYRVYGFFNPGLRKWHYPIEAAEFVRSHRLPPNLYNTYDWGGYLMWALYPDYRVFWDGRSDSREMFELGWNVMAGQPEWEAILERFDVRTVVTKACLIDTGQHYPLIDRLRADQDWALVFADVSALVFVKRGAVGEDWLQKQELPASRIDDTILSEANLLVRVDPRRYNAWWEMTQIYMQRRQYPLAFAAVQNYLAQTPERNLLAERYHVALERLLQGRQGSESAIRPKREDGIDK